MRILHTEWSNGWGGQERRILLEAQGMQARGHQVWIATRPSCWIVDAARKLGISVITMPMRGRFDPAAIWQLYRFMRKQRIDIMHTHSGIDSWLGALAAKLAGVPIVRTRHLFLPLKRSGLNFVHYLTDCVFSLGEIMRTMLVKECGFPPERVVSIPTGIDFGRFRPTRERESVRSELGIAPDEFFILIVGVIRGVKKHDVALRAFRKVLDQFPQARLVLAGDGPMRQEIEQLAAELQLGANMLFLGHRDDVADLMNAADVLLLTSRSEAQSQALTQGAGLGLPIVATRVGGVPEVVLHEETGLLAAAGDEPAIAAALLRMAQNRAWAKSLGERGKVHALANYSLEAMLGKTEQAYARLIQQRPEKA